MQDTSSQTSSDGKTITVPYDMLQAVKQAFLTKRSIAMSNASTLLSATLPSLVRQREYWQRQYRQWDALVRALQ